MVGRPFWRRAGFVATLILVSCAPFQDSPFSDELLNPSRELNAENLTRVPMAESGNTLTIAILADSHQNYADLDLVIDAINRTPHVDFVVNLGDVTNSGYNVEYDQFLDSYVSIHRPVFSVLGNHDALGAGPDLFRKAFGSSNFYFETNTKRFIFFNSANWEDPGGFDPAWLLATVQSSTKPVYIFTHCALGDPERFIDPAVVATFASVIADPKVNLILNGHNHVFDLENKNGTVMLQAPRVQNVSWLLLTIQGTQLKIDSFSDGTVYWATLKN